MQLALILLSLLCSPQIQAIKWRLFAGREDCVQDYLPAKQWDLLMKTLAKQRHGVPPNEADVKTAVVLDGAFMVENAATHGESSTNVDFSIFAPNGTRIYALQAADSDLFTLDTTGTRGPYKLCFQMHKSNIFTRPSVVVSLTYFTVNQRSLKGTSFEWQQAPPAVRVQAAVPEGAASAFEAQEVTTGLVELRRSLRHVLNEQSFLQARHERHMRTVQSTHARTFYLSVLLMLCVLGSAAAQTIALQRIFDAKQRKMYPAGRWA